MTKARRHTLTPSVWGSGWLQNRKVQRKDKRRGGDSPRTAAVKCGPRAKGRVSKVTRGSGDGAGTGGVELWFSWAGAGAVDRAQQDRSGRGTTLVSSLTLLIRSQSVRVLVAAHSADLPESKAHRDRGLDPEPNRPRANAKMRRRRTRDQCSTRLLRTALRTKDTAGVGSGKCNRSLSLVMPVTGQT